VHEHVVLVDVRGVVLAQLLQIPNLAFTLPEGNAKDFFDWFGDFAIKGNNAAENERNGTLEFLTPTQQTVLFTLTVGAAPGRVIAVIALRQCRVRYARVKALPVPLLRAAERRAWAAALDGRGAYVTEQAIREGPWGLRPGAGSLYRLKDGTQTCNVAVTVSLLRAEPSLRRLSEATPIACDKATALGFRLVRSYDDAIMHGLV
jgi:hypothetical protein